MRSLLIICLIVVSANCYGQRTELEQRERVHEMRREIAELVKDGQHEKAEKLRHLMERELQEAHRQREATPRRDREERERDDDERRRPRHENPQERLEHLHIAAEHLHHAGLHEMAEDVQHRAKDLEQQIHQEHRAKLEHHEPEQVIRRLGEQMEALRHELHRLAQRVEELEEK